MKATKRNRKRRVIRGDCRKMRRTVKKVLIGGRHIGRGKRTPKTQELLMYGVATTRENLSVIDQSFETSFPLLNPSSLDQNIPIEFYIPESLHYLDLNEIWLFCEGKLVIRWHMRQHTHQRQTFFVHSLIHVKYSETSCGARLRRSRILHLQIRDINIATPLERALKHLP
ncbi:unnamed protein product [Orchesella dallaii]|uniref:Uncharacterized protein n=1 Tax=Orchesella dallaii TaxID=48710 RepID=A0ABP1PTB2_9HEXA